jgi:hypothetical protein
MTNPAFPLLCSDNMPVLMQNAQQHSKAKCSHLSKHISWLTEKASRTKVATIALIIVEIALLSFTIIGLIFIVKGFSKYNRMMKNIKFHNSKSSKPPPLLFFNLPSHTQCFNHTHYYAIHNQTVWYRPLYEPIGSTHITPWKRMYFKGTPEKIKADGCNLVVINNKEQVCYRKVIKEKTVVDSSGKMIYQWWDINHKNNWKKEWFSLPFLKHFANLFSDKLLKIQKNRAFAISHRGQFNLLLEDAGGRTAKESFGITQLYVLNPQGQSIEIFDPWIYQKEKNVFYTPSTSTTQFEGLHIEAAASTVMIIGYQMEKNLNASGVKKTLQIQSILRDVDTLGWNPGIAYDYADALSSKIKKRARLLLYPGWKNHPLELTQKAGITKIIAILQTGIGNNARELRVEGCDKAGNTGFYYKNIAETTWNFFRDNRHISEEDYLKVELIDHNATFCPSVDDYTDESNRVSIGKKILQGIKISLLKFGKGSYNSIVQMEYKGHQIDMILNKRKNLLNFLGKKSLKVELIKPTEAATHPEMLCLLKKLFNNKRVISVSLHVTNNQVKIAPSKLSGLNFKMIFRKNKSK